MPPRCYRRGGRATGQHNPRPVAPTPPYTHTPASSRGQAMLGHDPSDTTDLLSLGPPKRTPPWLDRQCGGSGRFLFLLCRLGPFFMPRPLPVDQGLAASCLAYEPSDPMSAYSCRERVPSAPLSLCSALNMYILGEPVVPVKGSTILDRCSRETIELTHNVISKQRLAPECFQSSFFNPSLSLLTRLFHSSIVGAVLCPSLGA